MNRPPTYRATRAASTRAEGTRTPAEWRRDVERIAADAQRRAAAEFDVDAFIAAGRVHWRAVLCDTPLADVDIKLPVDEPDLVAAATLTMCERAIEVVLSDVDEPLLMAAAVARLVESSLHTFTDPRTGRTHRHLAAAKAAGAFFTPPDIALRMAEAALATRNRAHRCVEPASGTGVLSAALLVKAAEQNCGRRSLNSATPSTNHGCSPQRPLACRRCVDACFSSARAISQFNGRPPCSSVAAVEESVPTTATPCRIR
jgi:hypothetical protein